MAARKGHKKAGGRKKGTPNKATVEVKKALSHVFNLRGGVEAFDKWAEENPDLFYAMWLKMLPKKLEHDLDIAFKTRTPQRIRELMRQYERSGAFRSKPGGKVSDNGS